MKIEKWEMGLKYIIIVFPSSLRAVALKLLSALLCTTVLQTVNAVPYFCVFVRKDYFLLTRAAYCSHVNSSSARWWSTRRKKISKAEEEDIFGAPTASSSYFHFFFGLSSTLSPAGDGASKRTPPTARVFKTACFFAR